MTSPVVWADALARVQAVASAASVTLQQPNTAAPSGDALYLQLEVASAMSDRMEMGGELSQPWDEAGQIMCHVQVPSGAGVADGLAARSAVSVAFRSAAALPAGLEYQGHIFDPGDAQAGDWYRLSLHVSYRFQNVIAQQ